MTGNELYYIFSMSKLITVVGALTLLEKGKYSLNDNLSMYMPEFEKMQVKTDKTELFDANEITSGKSFGASENKSGSYYKIKAMNKLNIAYFGGSITAGAGSDGKVYSWAYRTTNWFRTTFPNAVIKENNAAIGGTGTVFGGTNDFGHGDAKLGNPADKTPQTFYGAVNYLADKLKKKYPNAKKVFITPMHRVGENNPRGEGNKSEDGPILKEYVDVIKESAKRHNIPLLDLYNDFDIDPNCAEDNEKYFADGLHPNDAGHKLLADKIVSFLISDFRKV